ncbi:MAG TPA: extracellular solute-binding protein [Solirubrobacteraceae bacterium]|nr:extracellular solute-binding protein [Solirubrobacteraceae bacterium]
MPAIPHRLRTATAPVAAALFAALGLLASGCGSSSSSSSASVSAASSGKHGGTLTLYSAQHEQMTNALAKAFEKKTGATVRIRFGEDEGLANQVVQEGAASPADALLSENTPPLELLSEKDLLAKVEPATLAQVPADDSSRSGNWVGVAARETVLIYNPKLLGSMKPPASILDLAKPEWKGKLAIAPSEPDFVPIVSAIEKLDGRAATEAWLKGFGENAKRYDDNEGIVAAVEAGQVAAGIINHYYWYEQRAEVGAAKVHSKLYYFGHRDPGALVNISAAGTLKSSRDPALAQEFLAFLVSKEGQNAMTHSGDWEYPLATGVTPPPGLRPFTSLEAPDIGPAVLGDGSQPLALMQQAGLL